MAPPDLNQPLATVWQCLAWRDRSESLGDYQGALGVSMGEAVASVATGASSLSEAVRLAEMVSALDRLAHGEGALAHVAATFHDVMAIGHGLVLHPAVHYGPMSSAIGGEPSSLDALESRCRPVGVAVNRLSLPHAYHTPAVAHLESIFESLTPPSPPTLPTRRLYSCVEGGEVHRVAHDHWWSIVGRPCLFAQAVAAALDDGFREFVAVDQQVAPLGTVRDIARSMGLEQEVRCLA